MPDVARLRRVDRVGALHLQYKERNVCCHGPWVYFPGSLGLSMDISWTVQSSIATFSDWKP
jgi:hypothetical protein